MPTEGRELLNPDAGFPPGIPMGREAAFPLTLQGRWVAVDDPSIEAIFNGSEITWCGVDIDYRAKTFVESEGGWQWVTVEFVETTNAADTLKLMIWPESDIHAFSNNMSARLTKVEPRAKSDSRGGGADPAMPPAKVELVGRDAAFPPEMPGCWVEESDPTLDLIVDGAHLRWRGVERDYLNKTFTTHDDGTVGVTVEFPDEEDDFDSLEMIALPNGSMYAYSVHAVALYVRPT